MQRDNSAQGGGGGIYEQGALFLWPSRRENAATGLAEALPSFQAGRAQARRGPRLDSAVFSQFST